MNILAFDTSTKYLSIALILNDKLTASFHEDMEMRHSSVLVPEIAAILKRSGVRFGELDAVALGSGPGSFTGLRIGFSVCKAFSLAGDIPAVSIPTLDIIARNFSDKNEYIAPILDARKQRVYCAIYKGSDNQLKRISDYMLTDIDDLIKKISKPTLFFGDGLKIYGNEMKKKNKSVIVSIEDNWYPKAENIARAALEKLKKGYKKKADKLAPMYLYPKECNVKGFKF